MNRSAKLTLMFLPLLLFFVALFILVQDARSPKVMRDQCDVLAAGPAAGAYNTGGIVLYSHSENPLYQLALSCRKFPQTILINDEQLLHTPVKQGQQADLLHKAYHYLPQRWTISIHTGSQKGERGSNVEPNVETSSREPVRD
jgi:hypothetical protein